MFLYIGHQKSIPIKDITGIFDINAMENAATAEFINIAAEEGFIVSPDTTAIKSFILANERIYFTSIVPETLKRRVNTGLGQGQRCYLKTRGEIF